MKKRILGLLLVICLAMSILPVAAMADNVSATVSVGGKTLKVTAYDDPKYTVNTTTEMLDTTDVKFNSVGQAITTDAENWNAKFVWNTGDSVPTLYLKDLIIDEYNEETQKWQARYQGADSRLDPEKKDQATYTTGITIPAGQAVKIVITGSSSQIKARFGITYKSALEIKSEGEAKLSIWDISSAITSDTASGCALTIDANLDLFVQSYYNSANSNVLQTNKADLTINGGNIKVRTAATGSILGITARTSGNIIINGGTIDVTSAVGTAPTNGSIHGSEKIIINGGTVKATAKYAVPIYAVKGVEINGGYVDILSPYYGINAGNADNPADIKINGGTLKIIAERACYKVPVLGNGVSAFAGPNEKNAEVYTGVEPNMHQTPWMLITNNPDHMIEVTEPPEETIPIFTIPTTEPTVAPSTSPSAPATSPSTPSTPTGSAATQAPTGSQDKEETMAPNGDNTGDKTDADADEGSNLILWIVIGVVAAGAIAAVVIIILKRKKA